MKCPYCGKEMTLGYIQNRDDLFWTSQKRVVASVPLGGGEKVHLGCGDGNPFVGGETEAWRCRVCKKIIIDYGKD
ncbi:PF20097 family protein [Anaerotignum sp.]|uniref:PF20097 family protein n=1 Tax=Anaerotignum sp. TaxID=2039241 RepID=UPI003736E1BD